MPDTQGLPWPEGDPGAVRAAARQAAALSSALEGAQSNVAATYASGWSGTAATAFAGTVQRDALAVGAAGAAFTEAAGGLDELATALDRARERVLEAAKRLKEAREAAAAAEARAQDARAAADSAHSAALLDPTSALSGPLQSEASAAEDSALQAEGAAAAARDELARVEQWANREAEDAVADAEAADQRAAAALEGAAGAAGPMGVTTGTPGGGPLGPLGGYLGGDLFNFWGGGDDHQMFPWGSGLKGAAFMYGTAKWLPEYAAWQQNVRTMGAAAPLTQYSRTLMMERLPTFNNGLIGRGAQRALSATPGLRGAGGWLSAAHKATPVFRGLGIAGGVVSTGMDMYGLVQQGNPVEAFQREGAGYVADVARTGFSASTTAFLVAPNPVTGGLVLATGAVWLGAEAWQHREAIGNAVATGADWVWDHSAAGALWNNREAIADGIGQGIETARDFAEGVGERLDEGVDMVGNGLSNAAEAGGDLLEDAGDLVEDITPW